MRALTIDVDGPLHVADFGGDGPTVVLVHGLGGSHVNWLAVGPLLARRHRVLAIDLPGFGDSPAAGRRSTIHANVEVVIGAIRQLAGGPVVLVGCSMGGVISLGVAALRPDLVSCLVLSNAALPAPHRKRFAVEALFREYVLVSIPQLAIWRLRGLIKQHGIEGLVDFELRECTAHFERISPEVLAAHHELERRRMSGGDWVAPLREATGSLLSAMTDRPRMGRWMQRCTVPVLLTHGSRDRIVSKAAAFAAADARPDWELHMFEDTGHLPILEAPEAFAHAMEGWLARQLRPLPVALAG